MATALALGGNAWAFNWNGKTASNELAMEVDMINGRLNLKSGHPLATARAFRLAAQDNGARAALEKVFGNDLTSEKSQGMQAAIFGSWLNEVQTNMDIDGKPIERLAGKFLAWRYKSYLHGGRHSFQWQTDRGYSSSNYLHSMRVTSIDPAHPVTQNESFDMLERYASRAIESAVMNLIIARKGAIDGSLSRREVKESWTQGMYYIGSVFHIIEDSAVTHSPIVPGSVPGDGHTVVQKTSTGHEQVVTLSDDHWYDERGHEHSHLDDQYRAGQIEKVYGSFDPATVNAQILTSVATSVERGLQELHDVKLKGKSGANNDAFDGKALSISSRASQDVMTRLIQPRYAAIKDRVALKLPPPEPASAAKKNWFRRAEDRLARIRAGKSLVAGSRAARAAK